MDDIKHFPYFAEWSPEILQPQEAKRQAAKKAAERRPPRPVSTKPVVLGVDTTTGEPVELPLTARMRGMYVLGLNGTGKSNFLLEMITQDITEGHGLCLLDPHGDLTNAILDRIPKDREDDLIILDLDTERAAWGLNIFACANPESAEEATNTIDYIATIPVPENYRWVRGSDLVKVRRLIEEAAWKEASEYVASFVHHDEGMDITDLVWLDDADVHKALMELTALIVNNPPLGSSFDQFEPEYGRQLSTSEIRQTIINRLVTMPKYTAFCQTEQGEYVIRPPYRPTPINEEKRARLRQLSRKRYYRKLEEESQGKPSKAKALLLRELKDDTDTPDAIINSPLSYGNDISATKDNEDNTGGDWLDEFGSTKTP